MNSRNQRLDAPVPAQVAFWNRWNTEARENSVGQVSLDQARVVVHLLERLGRRDLDIIDIGCGTGWMCSQLTAFGQVTGTDIADEVVARASQRLPSARFFAGDFMSLDLGVGCYDCAVSLEVLSHVADQPAFLAKIADLLRPKGYLLLATQNRDALERNSVSSPAPGQIRHWVNHNELKALLEPRFEILEMRSLTPQFNRGYLRYLNSKKLHSLLSAAGLGAVSRQIRAQQERVWLGWTLMTLAQRR